MNRIFRDEYTDFTFNGVRSSQMKVWITNNKDLQFRLTPEFSDTFLAPSFSNTQILNSTNITKSTFSLKCIAIDVTMQDWRAIQGWLSPTVVGTLSFDFNIGTYYNAKIDKAISGTTFVKNGGDRNISDRYIIDFTVGFVTVGDYAALGEVNVGILGKNFDNSYKIESVSNNRYFMPIVSKLNNSSLAIDKITKINNRPINFKYSSGLSAYIYDMSVVDGDGYFRELYEVSGDDNSGEITITIKKKEYSYDEKGEIVWESSSELQTTYTTTTGEKVLTFFGEELFILPLSGDIGFTENHENDYALCNVGAYQMYPTLSLNTSKFSVIKNNIEIYNYSLQIPVNLTIEGQNGFVLSQQQPIENIGYKILQGSQAYNQRLVSNYTNNGILEIDSGHPQLFRARCVDLKEVECWYDTDDSDGESPDSPKQVGYSCTFISPEPLQFNHRGNVAIHIFQEIVGMQPYNTSTYPISIMEGRSTSYDIKFIDSSFTNETYIRCKERQGHYEYTIFLFQSTEPAISVGTTYYISICNYEKLTMNITSDDEIDNFIYLQTRDAF